ncbi:MAG: glycerophosphodiester phosphodiesterase [Cryobacterium sp.]|nr:glycerophosphodiester phosphodiesterase [Oligoflexia bacterium]
MKKFYSSQTVRKSLCFVSSGLLLAACSTPPVPPSEPAKPAFVNFEVQGHRGARGMRSENTLAAFRYALESGVDALEMDLLMTKDNVLVVHHNPHLNPETCLDAKGRRINGLIRIRSLTLKQLKGYDCGTLGDHHFPEQVPSPKEKIPTFAEVLTWLKTSKNPRASIVRLNVETKSELAHPNYAPAPLPFTKAVLAVIHQYGFESRVILQSFDYRTLAVAHRLEPSLTLSALVEDRPALPLSKIAETLGAQIISPNHEWLTQADVEDLHAHAVKVIPWTPNTVKDWKKLADFHVDGMISDYPQQLLDFRTSLRTVAEGK